MKDINERVGYCGWCKYLPENESLSTASKKPNNKCHGCWCTDDKINWEKSDNSNSVFIEDRHKTSA